VKGWTLTVRHGPRVSREHFDTLDAAIDALSASADEVKGQGPLDTVKAFRDYGPERRVAARLELSTGGWLRGRDAGVDVMGDGSLVAYAGGIRKRPLANAEGSPLEALRRELG